MRARPAPNVVLDDRGFLPAIDHSIPADVSFDNYRRFVDALRRALELTA